jgi:large subunit ribosomal protein L25
MDQTVVNAIPSRILGSRSSRRLRAEGKLPGVVYGRGQEPVPVTIDYHELREALKGESGLNTVLSLHMGGTTETVIIRAVQRDPIKRVVTHADFLRVDSNTPVMVKVPIRLIGDGTGVTNFGGMIEQKLFELEVLVLPDRIPSEIEADIGTMSLDRGIGVGDLRLPAGVTTTTAPDVSVVTPVISRAAKLAGPGGDEFDELGDLEGEAGGGDAGEDGGEAAHGAEE